MDVTGLVRQIIGAIVYFLAGLHAYEGVLLLVVVFSCIGFPIIFWAEWKIAKMSDQTFQKHEKLRKLRNALRALEDSKGLGNINHQIEAEIRELKRSQEEN